MEYTNVPEPLPASLYARAVDAYVQRVRGRALAIYRVGSFRFPGLSDIDLLLVPRAARFDNGLYFAVRNVLPLELRAPFRSDPSALPADLLEALRYTTHERRTLLFGRDLAAGIEPDRSPEQAWSMLLERLCQFDRVAREIEARGTADLSGLVAKTKSIAYSLRDLDRLTGSALAPGFSAEIDALRAGFFALPRDEAGPCVHALFRRGLEALCAGVSTRVGLGEGQAVADFGRAFLRGDASVDRLDPDALAARREMVARVQRATRAFGFRKGDVFVRTPYRERLQSLNRQMQAPLPLRAGAVLAYRARGALRR